MGDWIKVEKSSPNKPEVMRLARLWGVPQDQAFGAVMRFWMWADNASVDGLVDGVASHEVDDMMRFPGFAQGMATVGWLVLDDAQPRITIPNFARHNSESAKKRALTSDRQSRWRNARVDGHVDARVTQDALLDKIRLDKRTTKSKSIPPVANAPPPPHAVNATGTRLDPLWVLPADWLAFALAERPDWAAPDAERVALVFRDHWHAKAGKDAKKCDWFATWRTWVRNERREYKLRPPPNLQQDRKTQAMDVLAGRSRERTIDAERMDRPIVLALASDVRVEGDHDSRSSGPERGKAGLG